jgi:hypothetical protein
MTNESKLSKYYRAPKLYVKIPSQGAFNPDMEQSMSGELAVMAMTGRDEVLTKNPDALLNGEAVVSIIKSCVPGIKDPTMLPITDTDTLLMAIRIASSGDEQEISSKCPKCNTENRVTINMRNILSTAKLLEPAYSVKLDTGVTVFIKPYTYAMQTEAALAAFDETKALQSLAKENSEISQSAMSVYNKSFNKMADMSVSLLARSIQKIVTPDGEQENNPTEILNFLQNIDSKAAKQIDEKLAEINALNIEKKCEIECQNESCKHVWTTELDINPTDFFVAGS